MSRVELLIVADDLTGACDAAIGFAGSGRHVRVELREHLPRGAEVLAVNTGTRDVPPPEAVGALRSLAKRIPPTTEVFKKIDSVFRGNTFVEIEASAACFPAELVVLAPSYPALGRKVRGGVLHVEDSGALRTLPIAQTLTQFRWRFAQIDAGAPYRLAECIRGALAQGLRAVLCDAETQDDLEAVVRAARGLSVRTLWIGSGGLAHALGSDAPGYGPAGRLEARAGKVVFFIGSDHPVTQKQIVHLHQSVGVIPEACGSSFATKDDVAVFLVERGLTSDHEIRRAINHLSASEIACLLLTGGDTAMQVCVALGIHALLLCCEIAPGVPLGIAQGGAFEGVPIICKSGGFGEQDLLCKVLEEFRRKDAVPS